MHRGLLEMYKGKPEQLSFILGHEVSHYLCEHGTSDRELQVGLSMLQLVVLAAVDPTGILALAGELGFMAKVFSWGVTMPSSRSHESEADALGLELITRACHDPRQAIKAHEALAKHELRHGGDPASAALGASHPPTMKRIKDLQLLLPDAVRAYQESGCSRRKEQFARSLGWARIHPAGSPHHREKRGQTQKRPPGPA